MPVLEDPVRLSEAGLRSDLVSHSVEPPAAARRKLIRKHKHLRNADFSSDEDDQVQDQAENKNPKGAKKFDPSNLTDDGLKAILLKHGVKPGPIVASTRALYERKLLKLLQSDECEELNEAENAMLYSDSENEGENQEEEDKASEKDQEETTEVSEKTKPQDSERAYPSRDKEPRSKWNSKNALKSSERSQTLCSQIPEGISKTSSIGQSSGLRTGVPSGLQSVVSNGRSPEAFSITQMVEKMEIRHSLSASSDTESNSCSTLEQRSRSIRRDLQVKDKYRLVDQSPYYTPKSSPLRQKMKLSQEPVEDVLKYLFPNTKTTPTGIYATPRRPIKGAAKRPIQYAYPDTPVSPVTQERLEVDRRLVPIHIQILVFFVVACILYFIYVNVEDSSSVLALLDSLNQWSDSEDGVLFLAETQDSQSISGQN